ncbi:MAG TPA: hypothetical protein VF789_21970 [Thermoanaerobaculia bacterium]
MNPARTLFSPSLILVLLLGGCGAEEPRLSDAGPRPAEIPRADAQAAANGAVLAATGRQSFEGRTAFRCTIHEDDGLQVNFRTGAPDMPAVALRIEDFSGSGPYHGEIFLTGRSRTGALVTSTGEAEVELKQRELPDGSAVVLLSGSFQGLYGGRAGKGSVEGRFGGCSYAAAPRDPESPLTGAAP